MEVYEKRYVDTVRVWTERSTSGYVHRHVTVTRMIECDLDKLIERCRDNAMGYQTQEIADQQGEKYKDLKARGVKAVYEITHSDRDLNVHLSWQHYSGDIDGESEWCDVAYENLGRRASAIATGFKYVKRVARALARKAGRTINGDCIEWAIKDPNEFVAAILRKKDTVLVQVVRAKSTCGYQASEIVEAEAA